MIGGNILETDEEILEVGRRLKRTLGEYGTNTLIDWLSFENSENIIPLLPKYCRITIKAGRYSKLGKEAACHG